MSDKNKLPERKPGEAIFYGGFAVNEDIGKGVRSGHKLMCFVYSLSRPVYACPLAVYEGPLENDETLGSLIFKALRDVDAGVLDGCSV